VLNVRFGQIPTGIALDAANGTMYVSAWHEARERDGTVAMVNVATCSQNQTSAGTHVSHVSRGARLPNDIARSMSRHDTLYVAATSRRPQSRC
jgi:hypothetical protein